MKEFPYAIVHYFNENWNAWELFAEFRFGTDFRADFVLASASSIGWSVKLSEAESPNDHLFTRKRLPTAKLNHAIKQTADWEQYIIEERSVVKRELAK